MTEEPSRPAVLKPMIADLRLKLPKMEGMIAALKSSGDSWQAELDKTLASLEVLRAKCLEGQRLCEGFGMVGSLSKAVSEHPIGKDYPELTERLGDVGDAGIKLGNLGAHYAASADKLLAMRREMESIWVETRDGLQVVMERNLEMGKKILQTVDNPPPEALKGPKPAP